MEYNKIISACAAVAIAVGGVTLLAPPASGKARPVVVTGKTNIITSRISFRDLNLALAAGELTLDRRVRGAIGGLCAEATGGYDGSFLTAMAERQCRSSAWGQARPQIARAVLRANQIASTGTSTIAAAGIVIALPK
jgi:UrcA family protein